MKLAYLKWPAFFALALLLLWAFWELFHCAFHICRDFTLLDLPGVKWMMVRKALIFFLVAYALCFALKKRTVKP